MQVTDTLEQHNILTAFTIAILIVAAIALSSCSDLSDTQTQRVQEALNDTLLSSTESWNVDMELIEEGLKKVRIQGSYAATYNLKDFNETHIEGPVYVQVFDSTGAVKTRATSERAVYHPEISEFELYGDVIVQTVTGRRLESEYLEWNQSDNKLSTPRFVIITTPSDSIAGNGFEGASDLSQYTIKEVTGQFLID